MLIAVFFAGSAAHIHAMVQAQLGNASLEALQAAPGLQHSLSGGAVSQDASTETFEYIAHDNQVQPTGLVGDHDIQLIQMRSGRPVASIQSVPHSPDLDGIYRPPRSIS